MSQKKAKKFRKYLKKYSRDNFNQLLDLPFPIRWRLAILIILGTRKSSTNHKSRITNHAAGGRNDR